MITDYSRWVATILFFLILGGALFSAKPALGDSTPPSSAARANVTDVRYSLNPTDPGVIDQVMFTASSADGQTALAALHIRLVDGGAWYSCASTGTTWSCVTPDHPSVKIVDRVDVR
jgi:hypothetical protein